MAIWLGDSQFSWFGEDHGNDMRQLSGLGDVGFTHTLFRNKHRLQF